MSKIITPNQGKSDKELKYQRDRVVHLAKQFIAGTKCRRCNDKTERKVVPLFEFGDPHLPSQVNIFCTKCQSSQVFALRPSEEAMAFAKMEMKGEPTEVQNKPVDTAEEMIEYAKHWQAAKLMADKQPKEETIKDEAGEIIANPDKVKEIDAKIAKKKKR